jgi:hypothetical protein
MYRIIDSRNSGKTSRLMLIAKEQHAKFACFYPPTMREKAYAYGLTGIDFISWDELINNPHGYDKIVIDEVEEFIKYITNDKLIGYTLSNED